MIVRSRAPLRLGLAGGGTDVAPYCDLHGGAIMNATIDRYAYAILDSVGSDIEFHAQDHGLHAQCLPDEAEAIDSRLQLLTGAYLRICRD